MVFQDYRLVVDIPRRAGIDKIWPPRQRTTGRRAGGWNTSTLLSQSSTAKSFRFVSMGGVKFSIKPTGESGLLTRVLNGQVCPLKALAKVVMCC
jgi:hypothetical protein